MANRQMVPDVQVLPALRHYPEQVARRNMEEMMGVARNGPAIKMATLQLYTEKCPQEVPAQAVFLRHRSVAETEMAGVVHTLHKAAAAVEVVY